MANTKDAAVKTYSYTLGKDILSATEKDRMLALFLNCDHKGIDWAKATQDFGAASVESMRVMTRTALKKITDAEKNGGVAPSPAKRTPGGGKKRKAAAANDEEDDEEAGTPVPKKGKGGRKVKKADTPVEGDDEAEGGKGGIKQEDAGEGKDEF